MMARCDLAVVNGVVDRQRWLGLLEAWPRHEVYAHPDYLAMFADDACTPVCLHLRDDAGEVFYPLILRDLEKLPFADDSVAGSFDAVSAPFGYGGPFLLSNGDDVGLIGRFFSAYKDWARDTRLVSEYTTFSPTAPTSSAYPGVIAPKMAVVVKRLDTPDLSADIKDAQLRAIRRARDLGVTVDIDEDGHDVEAFLGVYAETSARHGGFSAGYTMSPAFMARLFGSLGGYARIFHARFEGSIVSSELVLMTGDTIDFYRGGTASHGMKTRANQLLKYEICEWGRRAGYRWYLLGGGNSADPEDPLFAYKRSFARTGVRQLYVGNWTTDRHRYDRLLALRQQYEADLGQDFVPIRDYFPAYRAAGMPPGLGAP